MFLPAPLPCAEIIHSVHPHGLFYLFLLSARIKASLRLLCFQDAPFAKSFTLIISFLSIINSSSDLLNPFGKGTEGRISSLCKVPIYFFIRSVESAEVAEAASSLMKAGWIIARLHVSFCTSVTCAI